MIKKMGMSLLAIIIILQFSTASIIAQSIFLVENQSANVNKSEIDGSGLIQLNVNSVGLYGIAADYINNKIYYSNVVTDEILRTEIDGTNTIVLLNGIDDGIDGPRGIEVDNKNNRIYWAESISGKIRSSDLDGSNVTDLVSGLSSPVDVALDLENNKLYWSDNGFGVKTISRAELDGTFINSFVAGPSQLGGLEIDVENSKIYFAYNDPAGFIYSINLDLAPPSVLLYSVNGKPRGLALDAYSNNLFWTDISDSTVKKINLTTNLKSEIISDLDHPLGITGNNPAILPLSINLKVFLEGAYFGTELMNDSINAALPNISPYSENSRIIEAIPSNITDWVLVELRESINGPGVASKSVLLYEDGRLVSDDGLDDTIKIFAEPGSYFVVIKHRNHLPIMTANPISITKN